LIGPNGAGKSTLFNAVSGFVRPDQGHVLVHGVDVTHMAPHRRAGLGIGRTFQQIGLVKDLTVTENLLLAQHRLAGYGPVTALAHLPSVGRAERALRERAVDTLHALRFERFAEAELRELSHGQQRIVELAAALLTAPGVLLLDEPSAGMSPAAAEALAERLLQVRDELGQTILLIEHHLPLVMATCTTVHVMDAGRMLTSGSPAEVTTDPAVVAAYLGERRS
jgi:branched-chain amino acid transport system ATP-binding protein